MSTQFLLSVTFIIKILFLLIVALYVVFSVILARKALALSNLVTIKSHNAASLINAIAITHAAAAILLFLLGIVIL